MKTTKIVIEIKTDGRGCSRVVRRGNIAGVSFPPLASMLETPSEAVETTPPEPAPIDPPSPLAVIYGSELDYVSRCILDYPNIETGGQLFGQWTATGEPVVLYAIGPGPRANHQSTFFNQDRDYLVQVGNELTGRYGLQHIGEWHSHHRLGLARPSGHDADTMVRSIDHGNLGRFLLCIGNCDATSTTLNAFNFTQSAGYDYAQAYWHLRRGESPVRATIDRELAHLLCHPHTRHASHGHGMLIANADDSQQAVYAPEYWLKDRENNLQLKAIIDDITAEPDVRSCTPQLDDNGHVHLLVDRIMQREHIYFPQGFPLQPPTIAIAPAGEPWPEAKPVDDNGVTWDATGTIAAAFKTYYKQLV